jgi:hypothetical protein
VTTAVGDKLVCAAVGGEWNSSSDDFLTPTGGTSLTWTLKQSHSISANSILFVWTATATTAETFNLSVNTNGGAQPGAIQATKWTGSAGIGATSKGNAATSAPSLSLTTTVANSAIVEYFCDWNESTITGRVWRTINSITPSSGAGTELMATEVVGAATFFGAYVTDAGTAAAKTTGMTTPSGQKWVGVAVEVLGQAANQGSSAGPNITLGLAATGKKTVSKGTANIGITLGLAGTGKSVKKGTSAGPNITLGLAGTGKAVGRGSADIGLTLGLAGAGHAPGGGGTSALDLTVSLAASGAAMSRIIPIRILTPQEILVGSRNTRFYVDVLDQNDSPLARLDGVTDGELDWLSNATVKGGGDLTVKDVEQTIDWLSARLRPYMVIEGLPVQPLGVWLPAEAPESWANGRSWAIKLLDKSTILDQDSVAQTYALAAGSVVTNEIVTLIQSAGITNHAITASVAVLDGDLVWSAGTSKLRIINDLLDLINYFSLYSNFEGQMVGSPYVLPANRPIAYEFIDGPESIYEPNFARDADIWSIPNRVTLVGVGDGTTAALTSTADNVDPLSPYSQPRRGRVIGRTETGIEAVDQAALDAAAKTRLIELTSPTAGVEISHSPVPGLYINQAAKFRRQPAGIDARHVVSRTHLKLTGKALAVSTLREVVDL